MRITVEPLPKDEQRQVTVPLLEGRTADAKSLARHLEALRSRKEKVPA
jgi:hypothetical protein